MMNAVILAKQVDTQRAEIILYRLSNDNDQRELVANPKHGWLHGLLEPGRAIRISIHSLLC